MTLTVYECFIFMRGATLGSVLRDVGTAVMLMLRLVETRACTMIFFE